MVMDVAFPDSRFRRHFIDSDGILDGTKDFKATAVKIKSKKFAVAGILVVLIWGAGLFSFASRVRSTAKDDETRTDAIIALTGGTDRVATGTELLKRGKAEKLLISGVNRAVDWNLLSRTIETLPDDIADKITLGHVAADTWENALESRNWMEKNGFSSLRLVTAAYHMPRSLSEFKNAMPDATIIPHPVFPANFKHDEWWKYPGTAALLISEYNKFLLVSLRHLLPFFPDKTISEDE